MTGRMTISVRAVAANELGNVIETLVELLIDTVHGGEPLGFLPPLTRETALDYWLSLRADLRSGRRMLLVASANGRIVGSGQLLLSSWQNSMHRAELQKIFVATSCRGQGIGKMLLAALHSAARRRGRSLLVLNTRQGGAAETLYRGLGYRQSGVLPGWTVGPRGERYDHVTLYQELPA